MQKEILDYIKLTKIEFFFSFFFQFNRFTSKPSNRYLKVVGLILIKSNTGSISSYVI